MVGYEIFNLDKLNEMYSEDIDFYESDEFDDFDKSYNIL